MKTIGVYCASSTKLNEKYILAARRLGELFVAEGLQLIYGAGNMGLMGAIADSMLSNGGEVIGVIPHFMVEQHWEHRGCTELVITKDMHERKQTIANRCDAMVALPGGIGTLEELAEVLTWKQLGIHAKPIVILNTDGYYDILLDFFAKMHKEHFLGDDYPKMFQVVREPEEVIAALRNAPEWNPAIARKHAKI